MTGLTLSNKDRLPLFKSVFASGSFPDSYVYWDFVRDVKDREVSPYCVPYTISQLVEWYWRSMSTLDHSFDLGRLFRLRSDKTKNTMSFREAFNIMMDYGYTLDGMSGPRIMGYVSIDSEYKMKCFLGSYAPVLAGLPVYSGGFREFWRDSGDFIGYCAVIVAGYDAYGMFLLNYWADPLHRNVVRMSWEDFKYIKEAWGVLF